MLDSLKRIVKKYDKWCEEMGLTQEQSRCCMPLRKEQSLNRHKQQDQTVNRQDSDNPISSTPPHDADCQEQPDERKSV